jgi:hypothetical protein
MGSKKERFKKGSDWQKYRVKLRETYSKKNKSERVREETVGEREKATVEESVWVERKRKRDREGERVRECLRERVRECERERDSDGERE